MNGQLFTVSNRPAETNCVTMLSQLTGKSAFVNSAEEYCAMYMPNPLISGCVNRLSTVAPPYCAAKNPASYYPFALSSKAAYGSADVWSSMGMFINYVNVIMKVPFSNIYLMLINAACIIVVVIFAYKAIIPSGGTD
jgi:hypothetical protein